MHDGCWGVGEGGGARGGGWVCGFDACGRVDGGEFAEFFGCLIGMGISEGEGVLRCM